MLNGSDTMALGEALRAHLQAAYACYAPKVAGAHPPSGLSHLRCALDAASDLARGEDVRTVTEALRDARF